MDNVRVNLNKINFYDCLLSLFPSFNPAINSLRAGSLWDQPSRTETLHFVFSVTHLGATDSSSQVLFTSRKYGLKKTGNKLLPKREQTLIKMWPAVVLNLFIKATELTV